MSLLDTASLIVTPNGYKEGKLYSVIPSDGSGDLSVTRATTATRVNSAGLVELVPYNLLSYSEQFDNAYWIKAPSGSATVSVSANQTTAPNGTNTADLVTLTRSSTTELSAVIANNTAPLGTYKNSIWIKAKDSSSVGKNIDLWSWEGVTRGYTMITLTADWVRYEQATTVFSVTSSNEIFGFGLLPIAYSTSTTTAVEFYVWGAQAVEGSVAKDYQKTETRLNIPRLDYSNGTCPSILVEPQRTNLLTYSENLTLWNQTNQIASRQLVANQLTGVNNATKITRASVGTDPYVGQIVSAGNGTYTFSVYLWTDAGQPTDTTLFMYNSAVSEVYTLDVTLTTTPTRYEFDATFANTGGTITARIDLINSTDQYIYAYGAQLEAGSYATSYIPTTSASVTRNADVISKTGISSLIGQTEGTLFVDLTANVDFADGARAIALSNGSFSNRIILACSASGKIESYVINGGSIQFYNETDVDFNQHNKIALAYKVNDIALYINGVLKATDTSATIPTTSDLFIGTSEAAFSTIPNNQYKSAALWKTRLTNAQLATLTTI